MVSTQSTPSPRRDRRDRPQAAPPHTKKCSGECGRTLPLTSFEPAKGRKDGRRDQCRGCRRGGRGQREKEGQQARALETALLKLKEAYGTPSLVDVLSRAIAEVKEIGAKGADFNLQIQAVRRAILIAGCRLVDEIMEEARLSRWAVSRALQRLLAEKVIETRDGFMLDDDAEEPGRPPVEYHPADYPRGEDFSHTLRRAVEDNLL